MTQEDAIRKALACLRLAKSDNPNESALAAARAQEIIDRYQLDISGIDYNSQEAARDTEPIKDFGYSDPLDTLPNPYAWMIRLTSMVARFNGCRIISCRHENGRGKIIKVVGRPSDVSTVRYLYSYLKAEVTRLRDANCAGHSHVYKYQFCLGVVDTIRVKLDEQREATFKSKRAEAGRNEMAIMRINSAIAKMEQRGDSVHKWMYENIRGLRKVRGVGATTTALGSSARHIGQEVGKQVRMTKASGSLGVGRQ